MAYYLGKFKEGITMRFLLAVVRWFATMAILTVFFQLLFVGFVAFFGVTVIVLFAPIALLAEWTEIPDETQMYIFWLVGIVEGIAIMYWRRQSKKVAEWVMNIFVRGEAIAMSMIKKIQGR